MNKKAVLKQIIVREAQAYPDYMLQINECETWKDLQDYCESRKVKVDLIGEKGYLIYTPNEIVDWVNGSPLDCFIAFKSIRKHFKGRKFTMDLRVNTSYPIVNKFIQKGKLQLISSESWWWDNEEMVEVVCRII